MAIHGSQNLAVQTNQPAGFILRVPRAGGGAPPAADECCGECYIHVVSGGTKIIDCSSAPPEPECGETTYCEAYSGTCTYQETAVSAPSVSGKHCGAICDDTGATFVYFDYVEDNCTA